MSSGKILIGPSSFGKVDPGPVKVLEDAGYEVVPNPHGRKLTKEELLGLLPGVVGILAGLEPLDAEVLETSELKAVSRCGGGMSNVDQEAAKRLKIAVRSTPDAPVDSVAELTLGAMLTLLRQTAFMDRELRAGRWTKRIGGQLKGRTLLVIGFGRIGRRVATLASAFGARILAFDPYAKDLPEGTQSVTLDQGLSQADIVTLHASGEEAVLDAAALSKLKKGAFVLNAGRGGLIDEDALVESLKAGHVAGAWLDVFSEEPYDGDLKSFDQVFLTPHVGSYSAECRLRMETEAAENLVEALKANG